MRSIWNSNNYVLIAKISQHSGDNLMSNVYVWLLLVHTGSDKSNSLTLSLEAGEFLLKL